MIERVIVGDNCNCNKTNDLEFTLGSTFKIVYTFSNKNFNPPLMIPLNSFDMTINYYIKGYPNDRFIVKKSGSITQNCILLPEKSSIKVIFDNYKFNTGYLYADFDFMYYDPELEDRMADTKVTRYTGIKLVSQ
jgi:hypothetical protein